MKRSNNKNPSPYIPERGKNSGGPAKEAPDDACINEDYSPALTFPFLPGVYLGINAVRDARIVVEGPDCAYMKAQYIQGNHDMLSTLTSVCGMHRVINTALYPSSLIGSREKPLSDILEKVANQISEGAIFLTSMPMASITGADYERICDEVSEKTGIEIFVLRGLSLRGDWLDGYAEVLRSLAANIRLPDKSTAPDPRSIAIVGYLRDRNEADHEANLREIREMLEICNLQLCCTWLDGGPFKDLSKIAEAGTILSLPYGRMAARIIARRTGAKLIELPLPLGLDATEEWLRILGREFNSQKNVEEYIQNRLALMAYRLEGLVPTIFQGLGLSYYGDPYMFPGIVSLLEMTGAVFHYAIITNHKGHTSEIRDILKRIPGLSRPSQDEASRFRSSIENAGNIRLCIGNSAGMSSSDENTALFEIGFPSIYTRSVYEKPFLGFQGALCLLGDMANAVRLHEVYRNIAARR